MWWVVFNYLDPCESDGMGTKYVRENTNDRPCMEDIVIHVMTIDFSNQTRTLVAAIMNTLMIP